MAKEIDASSLEGFERSSFRASSGKSHDVYRFGVGPAVIVIHEVPGLTPLVAAFGRKVADHGMTAVMPSLFGTPGRPVTFGYSLGVVGKACISGEFAIWATKKTSPITRFLRELAAQEHEVQGGPGVGALDFKSVTRGTHEYSGQRTA